MPALRSNFSPTSALGIARRAQWRALGIPAEDLVKPKVAIVNTSSDLAACYAHLDDIVTVLKKELRGHGLLPLEIRTVAPSDFVTSAGRAGRYILPSRDLIVNDIEAAVEGAQLDAMICLSSCDKTTPAHLMAAGRLNVPTVVVPCGYQNSGLAEGREADVEEVFLLAAQAAVTGAPTDELADLADDAILGPGVCSGMATANSMHLVAEALGMAVSGAAPVRANSERMWDGVGRAAAAIADLIERDVRPRDIITAGSIANAVRTMLAVGGSMNTIKHLQAIAVESGVEVDVWELFRTLGRETPLLAAVRPNGPWLIERFEDAGGGATVLRELLPLLDGEQITVTGETVAQSADRARPADGEVIRSIADPFGTDPAISVLRGTLAPGGAVAKRPVPDPGPHRFTGPARVFGTLSGPAATVDAVADLASTVDLLHIAAHGRHAVDNPLFSGLDLADGALFGYDIDRMPRLPATVVLSACEVGRSSVRWGEEAVGMTRIWLHAGTRTVIAAPVIVADDVACELLGAMHAGLSAGLPPAEALAAASADTGIVAPFQSHGAGF